MFSYRHALMLSTLGRLSFSPLGADVGSVAFIWSKPICLPFSLESNDDLLIVNRNHSSTWLPLFCTEPRFEPFFVVVFKAIMLLLEAQTIHFMRIKTLFLVASWLLKHVPKSRVHPNCVCLLCVRPIIFFVRLPFTNLQFNRMWCITSIAKLKTWSEKKKSFSHLTSVWWLSLFFGRIAMHMASMLFV